ncbi:hypothetical protein LXL04_030417 [Taraxacum kok-saghyz]
MFLSSKSSSMASTNGATPFPDLSLQISPPVAGDHDYSCIFNRPPSTSSSGSDLSQENSTFNYHHHRIGADMGGVNVGLPLGQPPLTLGLEMGALNHHHHHLNYWTHHYHPPQIYTHEFKRNSRSVNGVRRSARAPRMRWTSTLHAHFIHAVQLLGGHERATPKSVQELMNVKDLTLAHVKSHLQMYRTVKSTDRGTDGVTDVQVINPRAPLSSSLFGVGGEVSPSTQLLISQRFVRSEISSLETKNASSDCQLPMHDSEADHDEDDEDAVTTLRLSKRIKKLESSRSYSSSLLNLEFTLGRPSRQVDQIF